MIGLRQATVSRQAQLAEGVNYVSTLTPLALAPFFSAFNSVNSLLIYGLVGTAEKIGNLPEFSGVGVRSKLGQESGLIRLKYQYYSAK